MGAANKKTDLGRAVRVEHDIFRLEVAVRDGGVAMVQEHEHVDDLQAQAHAVLHRTRSTKHTNTAEDTSICEGPYTPRAIA